MIMGKAAFEAALQHMIRAARHGEEGVGILSGPLDAPVRLGAGYLANVTVDEWSPLTNVADFKRYRYEVDPQELLDAYNELEGLGYRPYVMVHSHLAGGAAPSITDRRYATDPGLLHMVVDLEPQRPHAVLWRITPEDVTKVHYQVADLRKQENPATDLTRGVTEG